MGIYKGIYKIIYKKIYDYLLTTVLGNTTSSRASIVIKKLIFVVNHVLESVIKVVQKKKKHSGRESTYSIKALPINTHYKHYISCPHGMTLFITSSMSQLNTQEVNY